MHVRKAAYSLHLGDENNDEGRASLTSPPKGDDSRDGVVVVPFSTGLSYLRVFSLLNFSSLPRF